MDNIDRAIVEILLENSKLGTKEIAVQVGLTITPTYERIKRLEKSGVIQRYTIEVNRAAIGRNLQVLCNVSLKEHNLGLITHFEEQVVGLVEVRACYYIAGNHDYSLLIEVSDMVEYESFLRHKLASIDSIGNIQSSFVMRQLKV